MITLEIPHEIFPLMIAVICFLVPVIGLLFFVFIKQLVKRIRKLKTTDNKKEVKYLEYFGKPENIVSVSKNLTRVTVEVVDLEQVNFEKLRELNIGVLIVGNTIKCSSEEFASQVE